MPKSVTGCLNQLLINQLLFIKLRVHLNAKVGSSADHGRSDWLGYWVEFVQKAHFKKLACLCHIKQNDLTYLGRVCTPCLSVSTRIYGQS